jgi:hypothetical protein
MNFKLTWLPTVLQQAGLTVKTYPGWQTRGHGDMGTVRGILCHHTAGPLKGEEPSLKVVVEGRPDLAGPLSQLFLGRSGAWTVCAAGKAWHAGAGSWRGVVNGNSELIGIEAENTGLPNNPWPAVQSDSYARGCAAIMKHLKAPWTMVAGHKEYALPKGRKSDPSFDMDKFRSIVANHMSGKALV